LIRAGYRNAKAATAAFLTTVPGVAFAALPAVVGLQAECLLVAQGIFSRRRQGF